MSWNIIYSGKEIPPRIGMRITPVNLNSEYTTNDKLDGVSGIICCVNDTDFAVFFDRDIDGHDNAYSGLKKLGIEEPVSRKRSWYLEKALWNKGLFRIEAQ